MSYRGGEQTIDSGSSETVADATAFFVSGIAAGAAPLIMSAYEHITHEYIPKTTKGIVELGLVGTAIVCGANLWIDWLGSGE